MGYALSNALHDGIGEVKAELALRDRRCSDMRVLIDAHDCIYGGHGHCSLCPRLSPSCVALVHVGYERPGNPPQIAPVFHMDHIIADGFIAFGEKGAYGALSCLRMSEKEQGSLVCFDCGRMQKNPGSPPHLVCGGVLGLCGGWARRHRVFLKETCVAWRGIHLFCLPRRIRRMEKRDAPHPCNSLPGSPCDSDTHECNHRRFQGSHRPAPFVS